MIRIDSGANFACNRESARKAYYSARGPVERMDTGNNEARGKAESFAVEMTPNPPRSRPLWLRYTGALGAMLVAIGARYLLDPWLGSSREFLTIPGAVVIAVWFGGVGPGVLVAVAGFFVADYLFIAPRQTFHMEYSTVWSTALGYLFSGALIIVLGGAMRRARSRAESEARERAATESALRESEARFRRIADAAPVMIWQSGLDKKCTWFNQRWLEFTGRKLEKELNDGWAESVHPDDLDKCVGTYRDSFDKRKAFEMEYRLRRNDGEYRWILDQGVPLTDSDNNFAGYIGSCVDVTEHREAEAGMRRHQAMLEQIISGTPFMLNRCSRDLRYVFVSRAYAQMLQREPEEIAGRSIREIMGEKRLEEARPHIDRVLAGKREEYEMDFERDGVVRRLQVIYTPDFDEKGEVIGWFGSIVDRTEAYRAEETSRLAARRQEALYTLASGLQGAYSLGSIYVVALDAIVKGLGCDRGSILLFNENNVMRFVASRGLSDEYKKKVEGQSPWRPDTKDPQPISISDIEKTELVEELRPVIWKEGISALTFIPLVSNERVIGKFMGYFNSAHEFSDAELEMAMTIGRQLAFAIERERAETKLRESEERLRVATTTGKVGAWDWDIPADNVSWTDSLYAIHGVTRENFDGSADSFGKLVHPEDKDRVSQAVAKSFKEGSAYELTFRVVRPGGEVVWVFTNAVVVRDGDRAVRMIGATTDVTELKRAEEALLAAKQEAEEANQAKDQFLAALSHELRTPLTPVLMAATEMEVDPRLPRVMREHLSMIRRNIELEARLIDDLLDVTRIAHGKLQLQQEILDVHAAVEHAIKISASDILAKQIRLSKRFDATEHLASADAARLQEVFWNILRNAVKFTKPGGKIEIATRNDERRQQIIIEFADDGIGVEPELQPRIFDTFAQGDRAMRARFGGLGLGLAISKRIIDMHGGSITVRSDGHDRGSIFTVTLKCLPQTGSLATTANGNGEHRGKPLGSIMVVEDHDDTGRVLRRILESSGYEIALCRSVAEATDAAGQKSFDLVISDIGLPDGTGLDLMRAIRKHCDTPAVAISGYGTAEDIRASEAAGFAVHLTKPVDVARLRLAISSLLDPEKRSDPASAPATAH